MPRDAYSREHDRYVIAMQDVAGCVTEPRFIGTSGARRSPGSAHQIILARGEVVPLRGMGGAIRLLAGQRFRLVQHPETRGFTTQVLAYWYTLTTAAGAEIIAWHWTPDVIDPGQRRWPHLHVPTSVVSFTEVIRFAIEELGVAPVRADWQAVLNTHLASD